MTPATLPPWLDAPLASLRHRGGQLHHALLIHGPSGHGQLALAMALARDLLCEQPARGTTDGLPAACGHCQACHWFDQRNHPDFRLLRPEAMDPDFAPERNRKPSREIKIDQLRQIGGFLAVSSHRNGWRIVLIHPADAMNHVTANALLKTLEEPGDRTLLMLVTDHPDQLPATIRSRCSQVVIERAAEDTALAWIAAQSGADPTTVRLAYNAAGAPVHALALIEPSAHAAHQAILAAVSALPDTSLSKAADSLEKLDMGHWVDLLQRWISDLARVKAGGEPRYFPDSRSRLAALALRAKWPGLVRMQTTLAGTRGSLDHPLNARLTCESTLLAYRQLFERSGIPR